MTRDTCVQASDEPQHQPTVSLYTILSVSGERTLEKNGVFIGKINPGALGEPSRHGTFLDETYSTPTNPSNNWQVWAQPLEPLTEHFPDYLFAQNV